MPRPSLDEIFGNTARPVQLYQPTDDADRNRVISDIFAGQDNRPSLDEIFVQSNNASQAPAQEIGVGRTLLDQGMQGATFGFGDEISDRLGAGMASLYTGENYGDLLKEARGQTQTRLNTEMDQRPVTSIAANLAGGLLTGGAAGTTKAGTSLANSLRTGNTAARIGKAALAGAASGGLYGAGSAQEGDRLQGAGQGAVLGGAFGGAAPAIGAAYRGVVKPVARGGANIVAGAKNIVIPPEPIMAAENKVLQRITDDGLTLNGMQARLQNREGAAIIDAGRQNIERLGEAVANIPGKGAITASSFVEQRLSGATKRIKGDITRYVSSGGELSTVADDLMEKGSKAAEPLYEKAFAANKDISSPIVNRILETDAGKRALEFARNRMNNKMALMGVSDPDLVEQAQLAGQYITGQGGIAQGLKLRTLDFVKQGLDDQASKLYRAGEAGAANDIRDLAMGLRNELDNLDVTAKAGPNSFKPEGGLYKQARKVWGGMMQGQEALQTGRDFLKMDTPEIKKLYNGLGDTDKELFRIGVAQHMRDLVNNTGDRGNIAKKVFGREEYREKLQAVLGPDEFKKLRLSMIREDKMHQLNGRLLGNSRTLLRQQEIQDLTQDPTDLVMKAATGNKTMMVLGQMTKTITDRYQGVNRETAAEIANILFERNPSKQQEIILRLQQRAASGNKPALKSYLILKSAAKASAKNNLGILPGNLAAQSIQGSAP